MGQKDTLPGRGTGCAAGVCVFRADAPSFEKTEEATLAADLRVRYTGFSSEHRGTENIMMMRAVCFH